MKRALLALVFGVLAACAALGGGGGSSKTTASSNAPAWVSKGMFTISSTVSSDHVKIAAVGKEVLADVCGASPVLIAAARNRAIAALAQFFNVAPDTEAAVATLQGVEVKTGWFDGTNTVYALATIDRPREDAKTLPALVPNGGVAIAHIEDQLKDFARAHVAECTCGSGPKCPGDFKCEERQGAKKCICRGKSCPCEIRPCKNGETCGDGRCY